MPKKINKILIIRLALLTLVLFFVFPNLVYGVNFPQEPGGNQNIIIQDLLVLLLNIVWVITVTVVVILFITAGFAFMTAKGDPGKLEDARRWLYWAAGGVVVIILAFSIISILRQTLGIV